MILKKEYNISTKRKREQLVSLFQKNIEQAAWYENISGRINADDTFSVVFRYFPAAHLGGIPFGLFRADGKIENVKSTEVNLKVGLSNFGLLFIVILLSFKVYLFSTSEWENKQDMIAFSVVAVFSLLLVLAGFLICINILKNKILKRLKI